MGNSVLIPREALALDIIRTLRAHSYQAYLVGGCVRDRLLGIVPKDYDVNTDADPETILSYFPKSQIVGAHFGVVFVNCGDGAQVEVATFRSEGTYSDGRRPDQVKFESTPEADARRRDFTVNALMEDPFSGRVLDFVNGRSDIAAKTIRAIGMPEKRFEEDHLRMLRAVRFAARLRFAIEPATMSAMQRLAPQITRISAERVREELVRILTEGNARIGFELLDESGLLQHVLPEVKAFQGVEQPPEFHPEGDVWTHVLLMLERLKQPSCALAWGVLLHDVGKPPTFRLEDRIRFNGHAEVGAAMTARIMERLKFATADSEQVTALVANHMRFIDVKQMRVSTLKRFLCLPHFDEHLELHRLDCLASNGYTESYRFVREKLAEFSQEELQPARLITGHDLMNAGYQPGPDFGRVLDAVATAQLEGQVTTRDQALDLAKGLLPNANILL